VYAHPQILFSTTSACVLNMTIATSTGPVAAPVSAPTPTCTTMQASTPSSHHVHEPAMDKVFNSILAVCKLALHPHQALQLCCVLINQVCFSSCKQMWAFCHQICILLPPFLQLSSLLSCRAQSKRMQPLCTMEVELQNLKLMFYGTNWLCSCSLAN